VREKPRFLVDEAYFILLENYFDATAIVPQSPRRCDSSFMKAKKAQRLNLQHFCIEDESYSCPTISNSWNANRTRRYTQPIGTSKLRYEGLHFTHPETLNFSTYSDCSPTLTVVSACLAGDPLRRASGASGSSERRGGPP
jgi:hypothetical protein